MKKIGLLLGSFNPVTVAHLHMASAVLNSGLCDKVLFVVAKHNPWKGEEPAPFDLRCSMINDSIDPIKGKYEVCRFEEEFEPPVYSYLPICKALETYPEDELYIIAGTDTIERIPQWKNFETEIMNKVSFIEIKRGGSTEFENPRIPFIVREGSRSSLTNKEFWTIKTQRMDISSTLVRSMIKNGMNPYPYVTMETLQIINEYNLYR
jgi:nicotinate-nucleotide adenylyltransferase